MVAAYIGIGSNLDAPVEQVVRAMAELACLPVTRLISQSSLYRNPPLGGMQQPDYINAVAALETELEPVELLRQLQKIESAHGRVRGERWGARTLDLDLLIFGSRIIDTQELKVPHPEMHKRSFVLYPLNEISPGLVVPGRGPLSGLVKECPSDGLIKI